MNPKGEVTFLSNEAYSCNSGNLINMTDTQKDMQTHRGTFKVLIIHEVQGIRR